MQFLAIDMQPHFIDLSELPPPGKSAVWTYRIIYLLKDKRVGQWSDVVSVTVTTLPANGMPATLPVGLTTLPAAPLPPPAAIAFGMAAGCMSLIGVCGGLVLLAGGVILIIGAAIALRRVAAGLQPAGMVR